MHTVNVLGSCMCNTRNPSIACRETLWGGFQPSGKDLFVFSRRDRTGSGVGFRIAFSRIRWTCDSRCSESDSACFSVVYPGCGSGEGRVFRVDVILLGFGNADELVDGGARVWPPLSSSQSSRGTERWTSDAVVLIPLRTPHADHFDTH